MASATKRAQGKWLGRYRGPDRKERTKTFPTKAEALAWAQEGDRGKRRGEWSDPTRSRITVRDWSAEWLQTLSVKPATRMSYEGLLKNHVLPRWGAVRLDQVAPADVKKWVASMQSVHGRLLGASKRRQAYLVLSNMLALAVEDGRLAKNPAKPSGKTKGMLPRLPKGREHNYLTNAELASLAEEADPYRALILLLGYCGLRWGEATALRVGDVNLLRNRITVTRTASEVQGGLVYGTPKSHASRTIVPPGSLRDELTPWLAGKSAEDLVFTSVEGGPLRNGNFRKRHLDPAARRAGVKLTLHDLRHTAASLAVQSGANVKSVQRMLGHASAAMTLDTYAGLFDTDLEAVAERLDTALLGARADYLRTSAPVAAIASKGQTTPFAV